MSVEYETRESFPKIPAAEALIGAASPLWGFFAGAAVSGVAFWWMSRLAQPQALEALFARAPTLAAAAPEAAATAETAMIEALVEPQRHEAPLGGEAAPIGPAIEALPAANAVAAEAAASVIEAIAPAEPTIELAPATEPEVAAPAEPRSVKPRAKAPPPAEPPTV